MEFEWDEEKAEENLRKHKLDFWLACEAFADDDRTEVQSEGDFEELRWETIALVRGREIVVIYTLRGDITRLISARKAERYEREAYWNR